MRGREEFLRRRERLQGSGLDQGGFRESLQGQGRDNRHREKVGFARKGGTGRVGLSPPFFLLWRFNASTSVTASVFAPSTMACFSSRGRRSTGWKRSARTSCGSADDRWPYWSGFAGTSRLLSTVSRSPLAPATRSIASTSPSCRTWP